MAKRISQVNEVELQILESNPPQLLIYSKGMASSSGWGNPQLVPLKKKPTNGVYEFEFVADPPTGIVLPVLTPIRAVFHMKEIPTDLKGVIVHSATNKIKQDALTDRPSGTPRQPIRLFESLLGVSVLEDKLVLRVRSNGCTTKEHFEVEINRGFTGVPPFFVSVYRTFADVCKAIVPDGVEITFTFAELGLEPGTDLIITNPIGRKIPFIHSPRIPESDFPFPSIPIPWPVGPPPFPWPWPIPDPNPWPPHPWNPIDPSNPWGPRGPRPGNLFGGGGRFNG